jgi:hypothetical protein
MNRPHIPSLRTAWAPSLIVLALACGTASPGAAAPAVTRDDIDSLVQSLQAQKSKLDEQQSRMDAQLDELKAQKQSLDAQQQQIDTLRVQLERNTRAASASAPLSRGLLGAMRGTGPAPDSQTAQNSQSVGTPPPADRPPEVVVLSDRGGVLTPKGTLVYEPGIEYDRASDNRAIVSGFTVLPAVTIGSIDISKVNHDSLTFWHTLRYGATSRLELEARVPYVYRWDQTTSRPLNSGSAQDQTTVARGTDIGDIDLAGHYQLNSGQHDWPFLIANLRFKTRTGTDPFQVPLDANGLQRKLPTGSGFYNLEPSITAIYASDPAVFYANIGYLFSIGRTVNSPLVGGVANIEPGGAVRTSFGMGIAINEASSFSVGYEYDVFNKTRQNGSPLAGTDLQVGSTLLGFSYRINDRMSLNLTTAIGVTSDSPGTRIIARLPIRFPLFQ